ncbi:hypothetical protein J4211_00820 [Candidatus Woesearchaeota archaeon]|nr:hypothetical protein [Candidatus Woesearchaeota archaeon]
MKLIPFALLLLSACTTGFSVFPSIPEETGTIQAFFCDQVNCTTILANISAGKSLGCAIYDTSPSFLALNPSPLVVDGDHPVDDATIEKGSALMHNKFCVIGDDLVWTGSWNPSQEMTIANNAVLIQSRTIAHAYSTELNELARGTFHGGTSGPGLVRLNGQLTESYFCPEDECTKHVLGTLRKAQHAIHFMTFSFTDDSIGTLLLQKNASGIDVQGIFDPRKNNASEYGRLALVSSITKLHHKVFIIDGHTVITGSFNPSRNADERNDENVLILRDENIAQQFEQEFKQLTLLAHIS